MDSLAGQPRHNLALLCNGHSWREDLGTRLTVLARRHPLLHESLDRYRENNSLASAIGSGGWGKRAVGYRPPFVLHSPAQIKELHSLRDRCRWHLLAGRKNDGLVEIALEQHASQ